MISMTGFNPMSLASAQAATQTSTTQNETSSPNLSEMGKTEFLQLLVTQLQNQDPLSPLKNEEFIAQLASFSSLEQLISINDAITKLSAEKTTPVVPDI